MSEEQLNWDEQLELDNDEALTFLANIMAHRESHEGEPLVIGNGLPIDGLVHG